jgi:phosphate-selective porin
MLLMICVLVMSIASDNVSAQGGNPYPAYRLTGFMEQNFTHEQDADPETAFSVHRARVGLTGRINELISVNIVAGALEPPNRNPQLVNGFVDFDIHPMFQLRTGQFLVPFGLEGPEVVFLNPAVDRSTVIQRMNYFRMFRDVGIQASGAQDGFSYAIALINGTGANVSERIDPKDLLGRFGYQASDELGLGVSFHIGKSPVPATEPDRFQLGLDATWRSDPLLIRGEYILRKDEVADGDDRTQHGGYVLAGYHFNEELQGILRLEMHRPDSDVDFGDSALTILTAGLNYYFQGHNRVSLNYEVRSDRRDNVDLGNLLTVQLQIVL